jgi:23S rRNA (adenine2503-C2)-methyltransferase
MTTLLQAKAPTPPMYLPNDLRPSLMGLSREELAQILGRVGVPEKQRRMRMCQF